jgi:hypothetical protein
MLQQAAAAPLIPLWFAKLKKPTDYSAVSKAQMLLLEASLAVEDTSTTGGSVLTAVEALKKRVQLLLALQ